MKTLVACCALSLCAGSALAEEASNAPASPAAEPASEADAAPSTVEPPPASVAPAPGPPVAKTVTHSAPAPKRRPGAGSPALPLVARGDAQFIARDLDGAFASYQSASALDPKAPSPYLRLAECSLALGRLDEAVQFSELALRVIQPESRLQLIALSRQAVIFEARSDFEKALTTYKSLLSIAATAKDPADRALFDKVGRERSVALETRKKEVSDAAIVKARIDEELAEAAPKDSTGAPAIVPSKPLVL